MTATAAKSRKSAASFLVPDPSLAPGLAAFQARWEAATSWSVRQLVRVSKPTVLGDGRGVAVALSRVPESKVRVWIILDGDEKSLARLQDAEGGSVTPALLSMLLNAPWRDARVAVEVATRALHAFRTSVVDCTDESALLREVSTSR